MALLAEFNTELATLLCPIIFFSLVAFVIWGAFYSLRQNGFDARSAVCVMVGGATGIALACGLIFACPYVFGGAIPGMLLGVAGGIFGTKAGKAVADSLKR